MSEDLVKRLRNTPNWMREGFQPWKDNVKTYDRAPFEAADRIEALQAERDAAVLAEREACERAVWRAWTKTTNLGDVGNACHDAILARSNKEPEQ